MTRRRVTVVASEAFGLAGAGGPGTADSLLALALARRGHRVELLVAPGRDRTGLSSDFAEAGVQARPLAELATVVPSFLSPAWHVHEALRVDPPDVVVADDWRGLAYAALRSRQVGRSCLGTAFVLYCHGPARMFAEAARKVPDTLERFGEEVAQRTCLELADAVVSPSEWLLRWLREHEWPVPESPHVIQNLWESAALAKDVERARQAPIRRLAFFGQVRDGKGVHLFIESVRRLDPALELVFLGKSRNWTAERLQHELGRPVRFEPGLDRAAAIAELKQPGTLAVMPSLLENSPYAVVECLEHGIPFVASNVGGTPELVAPDDRARVLCDPTVEGLTAALTRALRAPAPARPALVPEESVARWVDLVETVEPAPRSPARADDAEWSSFGIDDPAVFEALAAAQAACGADVVTTGVREGDAIRLFLGDPGPLGIVENHYGVAGLIRRSAETDESPWVFCARQAVTGAKIVSVPDPLVTAVPAREVPGERLDVLRAFEHGDGSALRQLPQLAATLGAVLARPRSVPTAAGVRQRLRRLLG